MYSLEFPEDTVKLCDGYNKYEQGHYEFEVYMKKIDHPYSFAILRRLNTSNIYVPFYYPILTALRSSKWE